MNVGPTVASKIQPASMVISIFDSFQNPNFIQMFITPGTINEVTNTINNLQNCEGICLDGFLISVVKSVSNHIVEPFTHVFNSSLITGVFSDTLKLPNVTPVSKSNDKLSVSNYRPISLLPVFSKILENLCINGINSRDLERNILLIWLF